MKLCITTVTFLLLASAVAFGQGQVIEKTLMHEDVERSYIMYVPSSYTADEPTPLVVNMHGLTSNAQQQMGFVSHMNLVAEEEGFLVAYPNAVAGDWTISNDHNISFIDSLLDTVAAEYSVDSSRTYATGLSQGGSMSYIVGAALPDRFAAIAPVAGVRFLSGEENLLPPSVPNVPSRPKPLLHIHGTADPIALYNGGNSPVPGREDNVIPSVDSTIGEWVANNGCDATAAMSEIPNSVAGDGSTATLFTYGGCDTYTSVSGAEIAANVIHYRVNDAGHSWPSPPEQVPPFSEEIAWAFPINSDFDASQQIWDFFEGHQLAVPEPHSSTLLGLAVLGLMWQRRGRN